VTPENAQRSPDDAPADGPDGGLLIPLKPLVLVFVVLFIAARAAFAFSRWKRVRHQAGSEAVNNEASR
jgi:hypothetical protein